MRSPRLFALVLGLTLIIVAPTRVIAQGVHDPAAALRVLNAHVEQARTASSIGDLTAATAALAQFQAGWPGVEDGVRAQSGTAYLAIENAMAAAKRALAAGDAAAATVALEQLEHANERFLDAGRVPQPVSPAPLTLPELLAQLDAATASLAQANAAAARAALDAFHAGWPNVESMVKGRSEEVYRSTENKLAEARALLAAGDLAGTSAVVTTMRADLAPLTTVSQYGIFDALSILLREGLETILVLAALLAFLQRSGNGDRQRWIWLGGLLGVLASSATALLIVLVFRGVTSGSNREIIEGGSGLIAAALLFSVSYWLHRKAHIGAWQAYIRKQTTTALASGSVFSLALLAFLSVYREGAETTLFYIGIAPSISLRDLLLGVGSAAALLLVAGVVIMRLGVRLPLRPFFLVTSLLIFYLGFKFIGTGIHALQVAQLVPADVGPYLLDLPMLGLFPTWETTLPQLLVLATAGMVALLGNRHHPQAGSASPLNAP